MENAEATTFEDAWDAKYAADSGAEEAAETPAVEEAAKEPEAAAPVEAEVQTQASAPSDERAVSPPQADEVEALRKRYEGTKARYQAEERKRKELEARLQEIEAQQTRPKSDPSLGLDDVETEEIEAFRNAHPDIAKATVDDPKLAARWQKLLLERGEDEVIVTFETARAQAARAEEKFDAELRRRDAMAHANAVDRIAPDWKELVLNPAPQHENDVYAPEFVQWVNRLPMEVARGVVWALQDGQAEHLGTVFDAYRQYRASASSKTPPRAPANTPPLTAERQAAAKAAMAVPSKGAPPPKSRPGDNATFDELWEAKYRKS
jgi:hypothetical protein